MHNQFRTNGSSNVLLLIIVVALVSVLGTSLVLKTRTAEPPLSTNTAEDAESSSGNTFKHSKLNFEVTYPDTVFPKELENGVQLIAKKYENKNIDFPTPELSIQKLPEQSVGFGGERTLLKKETAALGNKEQVALEVYRVNVEDKDSPLYNSSLDIEIT